MGGASGEGEGSGAGAPPPALADAARLVSGQAWIDFCARLQRAGEGLLAAANPATPELRAAGFEYLLGLVRIGIEQAAMLRDPDRPRFIRIEDSFAKWGAENADNSYLHAHIRSDARYRISGQRGSCFDFLIELKEGFMHLGRSRNFATLCASELELAADGRFEILLARDEQPGNWLPLHPDATQIVIRQYFRDWQRELPASFCITRIGAEGEPPPPLTAERMTEVLDDAGRWVETTLAFWSQWVPRLRAEHEPGRIKPAIAYVGGADDIRYGNDLYRLAGDEAMIIECEPPDARYWQFQLCNLWFVTTDYANRSTSINDHQAYVDPDGRFRCVVAHGDPGTPNWLDTCGETEGVIQYRWVWTRDNPRPSVRIVKHAELRAQLPAGTPEVRPEQRREQLRIRQQHVARRERFG